VDLVLSDNDGGIAGGKYGMNLGAARPPLRDAQAATDLIKSHFHSANSDSCSKAPAPLTCAAPAEAVIDDDQV